MYNKYNGKFTHNDENNPGRHCFTTHWVPFLREKGKHGKDKYVNTCSSRPGEPELQSKNSFARARGILFAPLNYSKTSAVGAES